jgi:hypothetical protein
MTFRGGLYERTILHHFLCYLVGFGPHGSFMADLFFHLKDGRNDNSRLFYAQGHL